MRLMIDTNIILDVLLKREPFFEDSSKLLKACEENKTEGYVTASSITDLYYLIYRSLHSRELAYQSLGNLLKIIKVLPVTNDDVLDAYHLHAADFEDGLMGICAGRNHCEAIVTRDAKGFSESAVPARTPAEVVAVLRAQK